MMPFFYFSVWFVVEGICRLFQCNAMCNQIGSLPLFLLSCTRLAPLVQLESTQMLPLPLFRPALSGLSIFQLVHLLFHQLFKSSWASLVDLPSAFVLLLPCQSQHLPVPSTLLLLRQFVLRLVLLSSLTVHGTYCTAVLLQAIWALIFYLAVGVLVLVQ